MKEKVSEKQSLNIIRCSVGARILEKMDKENDLPLPNMPRLLKVMMEYFKKQGFKEEMLKRGNWLPSDNYWKNNMDNIISILMDRKKPFGFVREEGSLRGLWKFPNKQEYVKMVERKFGELDTRIETYNTMLDNGNEKMKYNIQVPPINPPILFQKTDKRKAKPSVKK